MDIKNIKGVIPPVVIPLNQDRTLDRASLERSVNRMIEAGVNGLFFLGSSSAVAFETDAEREEILKAAVEIVACPCSPASSTWRPTA